MVKSSVLAFVAIAVSAVVLGVTGGNTQSAQADTTTKASVTFTLPADSKVAITSMPDIDFGSTEVSTNQQNIKAQTVSAPLSVDNPGFASGWSVAVQASKFIDSAKGVALNGATIKFGAADVQAAVASNVSTAPKAQTVDVAADGEAVPVLSAAAGTGVGAFNATYDANSLSLDIPSGNVAANYSAALTWTLTDSVI